MILWLFFDYFFDVVYAADVFGTAAEAAADIIIVDDDGVSKTVVAAAVWYALGYRCFRVTANTSYHGWLLADYYDSIILSPCRSNQSGSIYYRFKLQ